MIGDPGGLCNVLTQWQSGTHPQPGHRAEAGAKAKTTNVPGEREEASAGRSTRTLTLAEFAAEPDPVRLRSAGRRLLGPHPRRARHLLGLSFFGQAGPVGRLDHSACACSLACGATWSLWQSPSSALALIIGKTPQRLRAAGHRVAAHLRLLAGAVPSDDRNGLSGRERRSGQGAWRGGRLADGLPAAPGAWDSGALVILTAVTGWAS